MSKRPPCRGAQVFSFCRACRRRKNRRTLLDLLRWVPLQSPPITLTAAAESWRLRNSSPLGLPSSPPRFLIRNASPLAFAGCSSSSSCLLPSPSSASAPLLLSSLISSLLTMSVPAPRRKYKRRARYVQERAASWAQRGEWEEPRCPPPQPWRARAWGPAAAALGRVPRPTDRRMSASWRKTQCSRRGAPLHLGLRVLPRDPQAAPPPVRSAEQHPPGLDGPEEV